MVKMLNHTLVNIIGVIGALLVLFGFYRTSIGRWTNKSIWYELDNFVGAIFLIIYQFSAGAYISVVVNVVWATVALRGLTSLAERYNWRGFGKKKDHQT